MNDSKVKCDNLCKKCNVEMTNGKAFDTVRVDGIPDFPGQVAGQTFTYGTSGKLVDVLKCPQCGWSVSQGELNGVKVY